MLMLACTNGLGPIVSLIKSILTIIQILIPIGLIIFGTIDLGKAVIASKEDEIKKGQQTLMKRVIAAVLVFLLTTIVIFVTGFVGGVTWKDCWQNPDATCPQSQIDPITGNCITCASGTHFDTNTHSCVQDKK